MAGQSSTMSASESRAVQKQIENGRPLAMCGKDVSTSSMNPSQKGGVKKKPISKM